MAAKPLPSQSDLLQLLRYDPTTGDLFWMPRHAVMFPRGNTSSDAMARSWNKKNAGKEAFTAMTSMGYRHGAVFDTAYLAHRVIWKMVHGTEPIEIDHINGDKTDNRIANLRSVECKDNRRNMPLQTNNTSGRTGVSWNRQKDRWEAYIKVAGKNIHLGRFASRDEACASRDEAELRYGFHPNHGRAA